MRIKIISATVWAAVAGWRYGIAAVSVLAVVGIRVLFEPLLRSNDPLVLFSLPVMLSAYIGGRGPGLASTAACALISWLVFRPPHYSFAIADPADAIDLTIFAAVGVGLSLLSGQSRRFLAATVRSEERLRLFVDHAPAAIAMLDNDMRYVAVSQRWLSDYRLSGDIIGRSHYDVFPEIPERWKETHRRCLAGAVEACDEDPFPRTDGTLDWVRWEVRPWGSAKGEIGGLMIFTESITARKQLEKQLRRQLEEMEKLMDVAPVGIVAARDPQCLKISRNQLANQLLEMGPEEEFTVGSSPERQLVRRFFQRGRELPVTELPLVQAASGAEIRDTELEVLLPSGRRITLLGCASPLRDEAGQVRGCISTFLDITERKSAEQARREADERFQRALENIPDVVVIYDRDRRIQYINAATSRITGLNPADFIGRREEEIFPPEVCDKFVPVIREAFETKIVRVAEVEFALPGAGTRSFHITCIPLLDEQGDVREMVGVTHDYSERKRAEEEIRHLNAVLEERVRRRTSQLEASNRELEAFAYSVSHDLRAPLRGIDGWSAALLEDCGSQFDEKGRRYLDRVRSETRRMGTLIDDLLRLCHVTQVGMRYETVDLTPMAEAIVAREREAHPDRQIEFAIEPGLLTLGDAHLLEIVLTNLLENAAKFTRSRSPARIEVGQVRNGGETAFFVRDNGVGFDMAYAGMLFGAFQRLHKPADYPGTGIGLATAQRIVHRHGGRIWAEAEADRGATFHFTLRSDHAPD